MERVILLFTFPVNAFEKAFFNKCMTVEFNKLEPEEFAQYLKFYAQKKAEIQNYIKYTEIVMLINKLAGLELQPNDDIYKYNAGDVVFVVTMKKKIIFKKETIEEVSEDDLNFYKVTVAPGVWL